MRLLSSRPPMPNTHHTHAGLSARCFARSFHQMPRHVGGGVGTKDRAIATAPSSVPFYSAVFVDPTLSAIRALPSHRAECAPVMLGTLEQTFRTIKHKSRALVVPSTRRAGVDRAVDLQALPCSPALRHPQQRTGRSCPRR